MKRVRIESAGRVLCEAEVADNPWTRARGLLGRRGLAEGQGLWIRPCKSIHTFFMRFPIDLVYVSADGTVVKTRSRVRPFRFSGGGRKARSVIELPPGFLESTPVKVGDSLTVSPADDREGAEEGA